jgi:DNA-binding response OmpR family regulator
MTGHRAMRLLLVDGGGAVEALTASIRAMGYEVRVADRLTALESAHVGFADVLVLDLDTLDGDPVVFLRDVCEQPGRRKPLVVAMTAGAGPRSGENGLHIVLTKPVDPGVLRRFRELLSGVGTFDP